MSSVQHLRRAGIGGLSALVCASTALLISGGPANASWAGTGGTVGIDLSTGHAATQVNPGSSSQALDDVILTVPNTFKTGDQIRLALFDRSASGGTSPLTNQDLAHRLTWTGTPTATATGGPSGDTAPTYAVTTGTSPRSNVGTDELVLTVGADASAGTGAWTVRVSGLAVETGGSVAPGEIRVVPFAQNKNATPPPPYTNSTLFAGNTNDGTVSPTIKTYTVPGYVMPASLTVGNPTGVTGDGTTQGIGDITVAELSPLGLTAGAAGTTYSVNVAGATVQNNATNKAAVALVNPATGETLASTDAAVTSSSVSFTLKHANVTAANSSFVSVKISGVLLSASGTHAITYTLGGGSVDQYLAAADTAPAVSNSSVSPGLLGGIPADSAFGASATVDQAISAPAVAASGVSVTTGNRISGADRYATAAQVALQQRDRGFNNGRTVILASGTSFPDALSAGFLSQRLGGASVLLTQANTLSAATDSVLHQLGTRTVYVVGGPVAISDNVVNQVKAIAAANAGTFGTSQVTRLSGADRYATNKAVNNAASNLGTGGIGTTTITFGQPGKKTALLATGQNFADALAATPATAGDGHGALPLLLTQGAALSQTAKDQINAFDITQVVIAGGADVVSSGVESELTGMGVAVKRIAGATRYETATDLAAFEMDDPTPTAAGDQGGLGFSGSEAFLATGEAFADALAGGPLAANVGSPILLTTANTLQSSTGAFLVAHKADFDGVTAFGGPVAIANAVVQAANTDVIG